MYVDLNGEEENVNLNKLNLFFNSPLIKNQPDETKILLNQKQLDILITQNSGHTPHHRQFLYDKLSDNRSESNWVMCTNEELFAYLEPYLKNIVESDLQILKTNSKDLLEEFVYQMYIFPKLVEIVRLFLALKPQERLKHYALPQIGRLFEKLKEEFIKCADMYWTIYATLRENLPHIPASINVSISHKFSLNLWEVKKTPDFYTTSSPQINTPHMLWR
jgi:hypothetical protein